MAQRLQRLHGSTLPYELLTTAAPMSAAYKMASAIPCVENWPKTHRCIRATPGWPSRPPAMPATPTPLSDAAPITPADERVRSKQQRMTERMQAGTGLLRVEQNHSQLGHAR
eukprot:2033341-Pleurochrysis_carterae.AAC.3